MTKGQFTYYNGALYEVMNRRHRKVITVWVLQGIDLIYPDALRANTGYRYYTYARGE